MLRRKLIVGILAVAAFIALPASALVTAEPAGAGQVQVYAQVDTSQDIYVGESFAYHIIIDGDNQPGDVDMSPLAQYNPRSAGNQDVSQTSISIINGRTTQSQVKRFVMSYTLTASKPGPVHLPPITVTVNGTQYSTNPVDLNILKPGTTDQLRLEVELSDKTCYVGQPVAMTGRFYCYGQVGNFNLDVTPLDRNDFVFEDPDTIGSQAKLYQPPGGAPVYVTESRVAHNGREAILWSFNKVLIPQQAGTIEMAPSTASADVAVGRVRSQDPFDDFFSGPRYTYKRFMVSSEPLTLQVKPLPDQGKPAGFYGLIGRYTISASAEPTNVSVGDPITLSIKIGGEYLKAVRWPVLEDIKSMVENFKIPEEKGAPQMAGGSKVFTQTIRANSDKVTEIPAIPLSFFDVDTGRYVTVKSQPISLKVAPTKVLNISDLQGLAASPAGREIEAIKKGLSANYEGADCLTNQGFSLASAIVSPGYLLLWAGPLLVLLAGSIVRISSHTSAARQAARKRRTAAAKAEKKLRRLSHGGHDQMAVILKQYVADRFDKTAGSLTADDCFDAVVEATGDNRSAESLKEIIELCEAGQYAPVKVEIDSARVRQVVRLIDDINRLSRK
jgi:hypothetical protein